MNLQPLFETQDQLDDRIIEGKGLQGQDLLDKKILALQVELGELANEWRGFKFWSEDQEPRNKTECTNCENGVFSNEAGDIHDPCPYCDGTEVIGNPLLEEYVDCLHFILNIGNDLGMNDDVVINFRGFKGLESRNIVRELNEIFYLVSRIPIDKEDYYDAAMNFLDLGEMLGFTWEEIEQAYYEKNEINHTRQENGY